MRGSQSLTSFGPASFQHQTTILARHSGAETVGFSAPSVVRLECSLRHSQQFLLLTKIVRLIGPLGYVKKAGLQRIAAHRKLFSSIAATCKHQSFRLPDPSVVSCQHVLVLLDNRRLIIGKVLC
jgi:hypothetical protein